jgi:ABC-type multidrug transport system fused ATPase/permease subunit
MGNIKMVFRFGWPYLKRYWVRLVLGVALGLVFGLTNASFVWATKTIMERLEPPEKVAAKTELQRAKVAAPDTADNDASQVESAPRKNKAAAKFKHRIDNTVDPWLPRMGRDLDWRQVVGGILFMPLLLSLRATASYSSSYCIGWASEQMINSMRLDVLEKLSSMSLDFFTRSTTGDLLTRINGDTAALLRCLRLGAADLIKESVTLIVLFCTLLFLNPLLTMCVMLFIPLVLFPVSVLAKKVRRASKSARGGEILQTSQLVELINGIRIIKAYHLEHTQIERYRKTSRGILRQGMRGLRARELTAPLIELIYMLGFGVMMIFIFYTKVGITDFVSFLVSMLLFFAPVKKLANVHIMFEQASFGVTRLAQLLQMKPSVTEPVAPKPITEFKSEIVFKDVGFAYAKRPVLQNLNLTIPRGRNLGIAGPSGSGKSTLINLLFRFYDPTSGGITIDGLDLRDIRFHDLRQLMALVSQDVILFDATVAENILCGREGATREEVHAAAQAAHAHEFIKHLPLKYDTRVGERGLTLSTGQRQRISIARAFIRNAPILVLDEATASLDSQAEAEVQSAIDRLSENRTVICVAHRLSTLAACDEIIVLEKGAVVERGGFEELLDRQGVFSSMARRQGITPRGPMAAAQ